VQKGDKVTALPQVNPPWDVRAALNYCVASATSGQNASVEMRDFELLWTSRRRSEVDEQTRTSTIYGRAEA
jgi:hypothetical protein